MNFMRWLLVAAALACAGLACAQLPLTGAGSGSVGVSVPLAVDCGNGCWTEVYSSASGNFSAAGQGPVGSGSKRALVCVLQRADSANDVTAGIGMTWAAQTMTLVSSQAISGNKQAVFIFGLRNPTAGGQQLGVNATNSAADAMVGCVSFTNVNQTSDAVAFPHATSATSGATLTVNSASGHYVVGSFIGASAAVTAILATQIYADTAQGSIIKAGGDYVSSTGASTAVGSTSSLTALAGVDVSN